MLYVAQRQASAQNFEVRNIDCQGRHHDLMCPWNHTAFVAVFGPQDM